MLTKQQVVEIYKHKLATLAHLSNPENQISSIRGKCGPLSRVYGVSSRTIRDIWNRRTWGYATHHLWMEEEPRLSVKSILSFDLQVLNFPFFVCFGFRNLSLYFCTGKQIQAAWTPKRITRYAPSIEKVGQDMRFRWQESISWHRIE